MSSNFNEQSTWAGQYPSPYHQQQPPASIENPYAAGQYYHQDRQPPPAPPDPSFVQSWDAEWDQRSSGRPPSRQRPGLRLRCLRFLLILGTVFLVFVVTSGVAFAVVGKSMLNDWYLEQEPFDQEVWCNRAKTYLRTEYLCELRNEAARPDNPFVPTLSSVGNEISPEDLLLTPLFDGNTNGNTPTGGGTTPEPNIIGALPTTAATPVPTVVNVPPTATLIPTNTPPPPLAPLPASAKLDVNRFTPEAQKWNNCGPTTLTMSLTYFGYGFNQDPAASFLKPNIEDKNVSPWQMVRYVNEYATSSTNVQGLYRIGGTLDLLKLLIANGFPVIIEKGYDVADLDWMGHYLLVVGYDDTRQILYTFDSYLGTNRGQGREETYDFTLTFWKNFNYTFIVNYAPEQEALLNQVMGPYMDPNYGVTAALERARGEVNVNPSDKWAWFNMGDAYARLGMYNEAATAFDQAFQLQMPWRTLWYLFTPFETYYRLGRYNDVMQLADSLDRTSQNYVEEAWYYRGLAYAAQGNYERALSQFDLVLRFNPNYTPAGEAVSAIQTGTFVAPAPVS